MGYGDDSSIASESFQIETVGRGFSLTLSLLLPHRLFCSGGLIA